MSMSEGNAPIVAIKPGSVWFVRPTDPPLMLDPGVNVVLARTSVASRMVIDGLRGLMSGPCLHGFGNETHYDDVAAELDALKGQCVFSTQNPSVLNTLVFDSARQVARMFLLVHTDKKSVYVTNPTKSQVKGFWASWQARVLHVSEILKFQGMW